MLETVYRRRVQASVLLLGIIASYLWQWLVWRASGRRFWSTRWARVHARSAAQLARGFAELGGVFIKLGQVMSVLGVYLPAAYVEALEPLQDAVPARPFSQIKQQLQRAWGGTGLQAFTDFDEQPLAAASLAQVHRATLLDGSSVAVKVLYPDIQRLIAADLSVIRWVLPLVHRLFGFRNMRSVVDQLALMLARETDCEQEQRNIDRVRVMLATQPRVVVPKTYPALSSPWVLVMSFEAGIKLTSAEAVIQSGQDPLVLADVLVESYLTLLLEHHVVHADPHPGNLLARDNQLVLLDYGALMDVSDSLVTGLKKVILGGLARNTEQVLSGVEEMGFVAQGGDRELLRQVGKEYLHALGGMQINDFSRLDPGQLRKLSGVDQVRGRMRQIASSVAYPQGYFYLERALVLLFGVVARLAPEKGLLSIAAPHASRAILRSFARKGAAQTPGGKPDASSAGA